MRVIISSRNNRDSFFLRADIFSRLPQNFLPEHGDRRQRLRDGKGYAAGSPAAGRRQPGSNELLEIALWLLALLAGLVSTVLFIIQRQWLPPLSAGLMAVVALLVFTYVQPAVRLRAAVDLALVGGVVLSKRK